MNARDLILGVDGGGTKTVAWLSSMAVPATDPPLGRGHAGPGNPRAVGFEAALANLGAAVDAAFTDAGQTVGTVQAACIALAGADRAEERVRMEAWSSQRQLACRLQVTNDAVPILAAVGADPCGIALISGTGSFAYGCSPTGASARCGGWGYLFGDEGSGYAIGLAGLRAAARAADGRDKPTVLMALLLQRLGIHSPAELVSTVYQPDFPRRRIAELAEVVLRANHDGDEAARHIVAIAASELAELVRTLVVRLELFPGQYPLALAGGVLLHDVALRHQLLLRLSEWQHDPGSVMLVPDPVLGAVNLARRAAAER